MTLKMQSKKIPQTPGVYIYKNSQGAILYIGKANNLHSRIKSYFLKKIPMKTKSLMQEATDLSWEILNSETEALIRESWLIKKWRPKFNILMRDDKQYAYVGFTKETFPKIFITHQIEKESANFIGPFTETGSLRTILKMLRRVFPYCTCRKPHKTPCLNSKIGRCLGFCCLDSLESSNFSRLNPSRVRVGSDADSKFEDSKQYKVQQEPFGVRDGVGFPLVANGIKTRAKQMVLAKKQNSIVASYHANILAIKKVLTGKNQSLLKSLKREMKLFSKSQHYEEASKARDQLYSLEKIFAHREVIKKDTLSDRSRALHALGNILKMKNIARIEGYDISNIHGDFAYGSMVVFEDGIPKVDQYRIFKIRSVAGADDPRMIFEVISRRLNHPEWPYPDVILIDGGPTQLTAALAAWSQVNKLSKIKIVSLAKREEELYLSPHQKPIKIKESSESLYLLLTHIRNESHRFAIKYYRLLHQKRNIHQ